MSVFADFGTATVDGTDPAYEYYTVGKNVGPSAAPYAGALTFGASACCSPGQSSMVAGSATRLGAPASGDDVHGQTCSAGQSRSGGSDVYALWPGSDGQTVGSAGCGTMMSGGEARTGTRARTSNLPHTSEFDLPVGPYWDSNITGIRRYQYFDTVDGIGAHEASADGQRFPTAHSTPCPCEEKKALSCQTCTR